MSEDLTPTESQESLSTASPDPSTSGESSLSSHGDQAPPERQTQTDPATGQPVEIDSLDRYRYKGRPLNDWESGYMRQQDYSQKTQALAQERKYYDNLSIDLDRVKQNPSLAEQFRSIYPEKYHGYLRYVLENSGQTQPAQRPYPGGQPGQQFAKLDPSVEMRINQIEKSFRDKEVAAISAELDHKFKTLSQKYPFADEEAVISRAQALLNKMKEMDPMNPNLKISDKQWDALWKGQNERSYGLSDAAYKKQVQNQIQANRKGADAGKGGGIPGQAPRQFKTIKEATTQALADIELGSI